ncbi:MAG: ABC transporter permease [Anaerolineae bacterium]|nr:ABC transporter permease [Anaerolineae bacterium]
MESEIALILGSILANATPVVIASIGETITERVGVINLSLDGSLQICAMLGFVAAYTSGSATLGLLAGTLAGLLVALLIVFSNIELRQDQVAVGFVLTLLLADLAQFLGQDYTRIPGPSFPTVPIPLLADIPFIGPIFFRHNVLVYFSFILVFATWYVMYRTRWGLALRAVGERPAAAFARGTNVNRTRYLYTAIGGALVGVAGASYALAIKPGWANPAVMRGDGWIALAIVIFGGWHPLRAAFGAYLFTGLRALASTIQQTTEFPLVLVNAVPWVLMILTLLMVSSGFVERMMRVSPPWAQRLLRNFLRSDSPMALGTHFERE